jgi:predicted ArsR family transcriptional regulator
MLTLLREEGPATATQLAERLGQSSAATSYHLRQLAAYGFVADDTERGTGRERWWRAAHRATYFALNADDPDEAVLGEAYLGAVARTYAERMEAWVGEALTVDPAWRRASTLSDVLLRLTPAQTEEFTQAIMDVVGRFPADDPESADEVPEGAERVAFQFQVFPRLGAPGTP